MKSWLDFWNQDTPIYANDRHKLRHYQGLARDFAAFIEHPHAAILDYGCGEALCADQLAAHCGQLILIDGAPIVRARLAKRFEGHPSIRLLAPEHLADIPASSLDLVVIHSLAQYLAPSALDALLDALRATLKPGGTLVLGDILPRGLSPLTDALALLAFGWRDGFFISAIFGLIRTALSEYRQIKGHLGLTTYDADDIIARLERRGFHAERLAHNPGHNQARMAFMGRKIS